VSQSLERLTAALADRYRIERELGAGGMATVYLAEDLKHKRQVAIKVLRPELAAVIGAERFLAEITTTANLQHPHILPLHDSGQVDGTVFYVMPLVEGESLRDRLVREKQLPVTDAVRIASEVASALDYAHRHDVIHRDIKPENILLHDDRALVADFGIALAATKSDSGSRMTETGMSLGTPTYMSPEQAMGERDLDARTDIYALGCVLYEMLAGEPPFTGPTAQAIVARVMTEHPRSLTDQRRTIPPHVDAVVQTAMAKLPADRFATAREMTAALGNPAFGRDRAGAGGAALPFRQNRPALVLGAVALVAVAVALWGWLPTGPTPPSQPPSRLAVPVPSLGGSAIALQRQIAITPDGRTLLYVADNGLGETVTMQRPLDAIAAVPVPGVLPFLGNPVIATDGREFVGGLGATQQMYRYSIAGGMPKPLPAGVAFTSYMAWGEDGSLWLSGSNTTDQGISRIDRAGTVTRPFGSRHSSVVINQILPGGRKALVVLTQQGLLAGALQLLDLQSGELTMLLDRQILEARYTVGHLVYVEPPGSLMAVPFNLSAQRIEGEPAVLATGVSTTGTGLAQMAVADNGTVAYVPEEPRSLVLIDRAGSSRLAFPEGRNFHSPRFSPDGRRMLTDFNTADGRDVWVLDLVNGGMTRATSSRDGHDANWMPDGRSIVYSSVVNGLLGVFRTRLGSAEPPESLMVSSTLGYSGIPLGTGDSMVTVGNSLQPGSGGDIGMLQNGGRGPLEPLVASRFDEGYPAVSSDGRWLAYVSNLSGQNQVYIRPLNGDGEQVQVSLEGGTEPVWGPDGRELFYLSSVGAAASLMAATVQTSPTLAVTARRTLFPVTDIATATPHSNYDISPDGRTFAMVRFNPATRIMIIQNLPALVRRLSGGQGTQP